MNTLLLILAVDVVALLLFLLIVVRVGRRDYRDGDASMDAHSADALALFDDEPANTWGPLDELQRRRDAKERR